MNLEKICVLGGSGFVGTVLVSELASRGLFVRVLTRRREQAKALILLPTVEVIEADVHDEHTLARQFMGCDAVVNLIGILHASHQEQVEASREGLSDFHRVHVELPRKVIAACTKAGIRRLLHMSALGADQSSLSAYQQSKGAGEALVREAGKDSSSRSDALQNDGQAVRRGMQTTIFRPSVIFGPGDRFLNLFAGFLRRLPIFPVVCPGARFQPVYVKDVACAFASSLSNPETFGKTYDLCGPRVYTMLELIQFLTYTLGLERKLIPLSDRLSYWNAWLLEHKPGRKILTRDNYYAMQTPNVCEAINPSPPGWKPAALEAVAPTWLQGASQRDRYAFFRHQARR